MWASLHRGTLHRGTLHVGSLSTHPEDFSPVTNPLLPGALEMFDARDMNGTGDSNTGWSNNDAVGTPSKPWVGRGSLGSKLFFGLGLGAAKYKTNRIGGIYPAVDFEANNDALVSDRPASDYKLLHDGSPHTLYCLCRLHVGASGLDNVVASTGNITTGGSGFWLRHDGNGTPDQVKYEVTRSVGGTWRKFLNSGDNTFPPDDSWRLMHVRHRPGDPGNDWDLWDDSTFLAGGESDNPADTVNNPDHTLYLGTSNIWTMDGEIAFFAIYPTAHTTAEVAQMRAAIKERYGLP